MTGEGIEGIMPESPDRDELALHDGDTFDDLSPEDADIARTIEAETKAELEAAEGPAPGTDRGIVEPAPEAGAAAPAGAGAGAAKPAELSDQFINAALEIGFGSAEIAKLGPEQIQMIERFATVLDAQRGLYPPSGYGRDAAPQRGVQPGPPGDGEYRPLELPLDTLREEHGETFDPLFNPIVERITQFENVLGEVLFELRESKAAQDAQALDSFVAELGDEFATLFGKGPGGGLPENSRFSRARNQLAVDAQGLMQWRRQQGENLTYTQALKEAARMQTQEQTATVERGKIRTALTKQRGQFSMPPSARGGTGPPGGEDMGREAAIREVKAEIARQKERAGVA